MIPQTAKLAKNDIDLTVYARHSVDLIGKCTFYMLSKATKQPIKVKFYVAKEEGSVLLSWETVFQLQFLNVKPQIRISSPQSDDHIQCSWSSQKRDTCTILQHLSFLLLPLQYPRKTHKGESKLWNQRSKIQEQYPELFKGIGWFPGEPYHIHVNPSITPKQTPCRPIAVHEKFLKQTFWQEIEKMLATGVIKPVHETTPWINSFILVESTDKSTGNPKLSNLFRDPN